MISRIRMNLFCAVAALLQVQSSVLDHSPIRLNRFAIKSDRGMV
jgi:hypothetical protein